MRVLSTLLAGVIFGMGLMTFMTGEAAAKTANKSQLNLMNLPEWKVMSADVGGTLLFSDSPEIVEEDGILYSDTVQGKTRLLYYHLNGTQSPKKIVAVLENTTDQDVDITISNYAFGGPSADYLYVGKTTQEQYFKNANIAFAHVPAHGKKLLSAKLDKIVVDPEKLVYGIFDFNAVVPLKVTMLMLPVNENPLTFVDRAKVLPADKAKLRGTFTGMDRIIKGEKVYNGKRDGNVAITLADGKLDQYRTGIDATDGSIVENYGNYGILYKIHIPTQGFGKTNYYLNPRGGVYAGALNIKRSSQEKGDMIPTPLNKPFFGENNSSTDITFLGQYNNFDELWIEFSPPGASNLPARLILQPQD
ncbi:copper amine oxidase [Anaerosinus massiliensis]|uniref:copper amine oxidase n=1 Tax=Massilibacillus massiliensis TaxID=1806837 RepID=UPI000AA4FC38|nr:copper amine oxidase [Massilibacillus massiliensis]